MSTDRKPTNPQVFPITVKVPVLGGETTKHTNAGLTLRDLFAGLALAGMVMDKAQWGANPATMASNAYLVADAMLNAREEG